MGRNLIIYIYYLALCLLLACSPKQKNTDEKKSIRERNFIKYDYQTYFDNDSLQLSITFPGDFVFDSTLNLSSETNQILSSVIKDSILSSSIKKNILFKNYSTHDNTLHYTAFVLDTSILYKKIFSDFKQQYYKIESVERVFYSKDFLPESSAFVASLYIIPANKFSLLLIAYETCSENKSDSLMLLRRNLEDEFFDMKNGQAGILNYILFDESYKPYHPKPAQILAQEAFDQRTDNNIGASYDTPIGVLLNSEVEYSRFNAQSDWLQTMMTYLSFMGDNNMVKLYREKWDSLIGIKKQVIGFDELKKMNLELADAKDIILKAAEKNQVVMFNESHFEPPHRLFVSSLLQDLYQRGYRYLAIETLSEDIDINKRGFPILTDGFYQREYQMANLMRHALKLGFKLVAYEDTSQFSESNRELIQAKNLNEKIFKLNKTAKVIVYAGFSHIYEHQKFAKTSEQKWMAEYFKELTNIDPLTVNQTDLMNVNLSPEISEKMSKPYCMLNEGKMVGSISPFKIDSLQCDIYINHSSDYSSKAEPSFSQIQDISITLPKGIFSSKTLSVVILYSQEELDKLAPETNLAVPIFVQPLRNERLSFILQKGKYHLYVRNFGSTLHDTLFQVN
jgi:hypothetical protein